MATHSLLGSEPATGGPAVRTPPTPRPPARPSRTSRPARPARSLPQERWARVWRGRRVGPLSLISLLAWQLTIAGVVVTAVVAPGELVVALLAFVLVIVLTVVRSGGRSLARGLNVRRRLAARRRAARGSACTQGFPLAQHDALVPFLYLRPDLSVDVASARSGDPVGVIGDGSGFTAVLAPANEPVVPSMRPTSVGIGTLADLCDPDGVGVDSVQLVVRVLPAPAAASAAAVSGLARSYRQVKHEQYGRRGVVAGCRTAGRIGRRCRAPRRPAPGARPRSGRRPTARPNCWRRRASRVGCSTTARCSRRWPAASTPTAVGHERICAG